MPVAHKAFLDLENALTSRVMTAWAKQWKMVKGPIQAAVDQDDFDTANKLVDLINLDALVKKQLTYARTIGMSALLLGASRLVEPKDSVIAQNVPKIVLDNGILQWGLIVARNAALALRMSAHLMLHKFQYARQQAAQKIQKDEINEVYDANDLREASTPVISLDLDDLLNDGNAYIGTATSLMVSRLSAFGFLAEAFQQGHQAYEVSAVLDEHTCPICEEMDGTQFPLASGIAQANAVMNADDPDALQLIAPWPSNRRSNVERISQLDSTDRANEGLAMPPYHPGCRCILVMTDVEGGEDDGSGSAVNPDNQSSLPTSAAVLAGLLRSLMPRDSLAARVVGDTTDIEEEWDNLADLVGEDGDEAQAEAIREEKKRELAHRNLLTDLSLGTALGLDKRNDPSQASEDDIQEEAEDDRHRSG
jgi:hypothetical protein